MAGEIQYAHVINVQIQAGKVEDGIKAFRMEIIPVLRRLKDYRGSYLMVDRDKNEASVVSFWAVKRRGRGVVAQHGPGILPSVLRPVRRRLLTGRPQLEHYELALQDRPRGPGAGGPGRPPGRTATGRPGARRRPPR